MAKRQCATSPSIASASAAARARSTTRSGASAASAAPSAASEFGHPGRAHRRALEIADGADAEARRAEHRQAGGHADQHRIPRRRAGRCRRCRRPMSRATKPEGGDERQPAEAAEAAARSPASAPPSGRGRRAGPRRSRRGCRDTAARRAASSSPDQRPRARRLARAYHPVQAGSSPGASFRTWPSSHDGTAARMRSADLAGLAPAPVPVPPADATAVLSRMTMTMTSCRTVERPGRPAEDLAADEGDARR